MARFRLPKPRLIPAEVAADGDGAVMGFFDHLEELRFRAMRAFLALIVGTLIGVAVAPRVLKFLVAPYGDLLQTLGPTEGVVSFFRVALLVGGILAIPVITYQFLMFILPALDRKQTRFVLLSIPAVTVLFLVGVIFAWTILVPPALGFLSGFQPTIFKPEWTAPLYLGFVTSLLFWMGVAFETPLVLFVLSLMGFLGAGALIRNWRIAIVASSIAAAVITPTIDPVNMFLVMGPLLSLYVISIVLVAFGSRINRNQ
ncbi:MAG: twin-arginine translocase subunit TatC [Chloroflexi bacterium]|nr:MAG: twin-arginine translocase subunit TatC [Phototrophicales bacterium]RMF79204.1 MAG: twin-arginine translocase subunit TatC [Chloroflexota bacterium]